MTAHQFSSVLLEISNELSSDNLDKMKFLLQQQIGKRDLERITTGHKLFQTLTERGKLGADNTDFLSELLTGIHRPDLSDKLNHFDSYVGSAISPLDETEKAKLDVATAVIAENIGRSWRKLGRRLRLSEVKLESISRRHPTDLEETAVELLKDWRKIRGAEARAEELIGALRDCQYNLTADKVEEKLRDLQ